MLTTIFSEHICKFVKGTHFE